MAKIPNWTKEEDNLLTAMYQEGLTDNVISERLNRPVNGIIGRRSRLGLTKEPLWNNDRIKNELLKCIDQLMLDRMPTAAELKGIGRNDLHVKLCRTKKYSGWAKELGLTMKASETTTGQKYEDITFKLLNEFKVERMSTKYPYDLLVDDCVKVDVKSAKPNRHNGSRCHTFGINKKNPTCDIYLVIALDEEEQIEKVFVIPSHNLTQTTLTIGTDSKWNHFIGRWDYLYNYVEFYTSMRVGV